MAKGLALKPKRTNLPLAVWLIGLALIVAGVAVNWPTDSKSSNGSSSNSAPVNAAVDPAAAIYTDYFDASWRAGDTQSSVLTEATFMYAELVAALNNLPVKSGHQSEISDRLALLKPNTNSLVFYVTVSSEVDEIDGFDLAAAEVTDGQGNSYSILKWEEASAALLPETTAHQRVGLLAASLTSTNGQALDSTTAGSLKLTLKNIGGRDQRFTWDLNLLNTFLTNYGRI